MQPDRLMAMAADLISKHPGQLTKSTLVQRIGGRRQRAWDAVERLLAEGLVATLKDDRGYMVFVPATGTPAEHVQEHAEHVVDGQNGDKAGTPVPGSASGQTDSANPGKSAKVLSIAGNGAQPMLFREPRCRVCRNPNVLSYVNNLLSSGFTTAALVDVLTGINSELPAKSRITRHCVDVHKERHYARQQPMAAAYRRVLEVADAESGGQGSTIVDPETFFAIVVAKSLQTMTAEGVEVSVGEGIAAGRELVKLRATDSTVEQMARIMAKQNRILEVWKLLPEQYQEMLLAKLEDRPWPPPASAQLVAIDGGLATDEEFGDEEREFRGPRDDYDDEDDD